MKLPLRTLLTGALLLVSGAIAEAGSMPAPTTLAQLRDVARPLLVFAPSASDPRLQQQAQIVGEHQEEANERDMLTVLVPAQGAVGGETSLTSADAVAARARFSVGPTDFVVILVGKDGGEKLKDRQPVAFDRLSALIDAMPMRRVEMKAKAK